MFGTNIALSDLDKDVVHELVSSLLSMEARMEHTRMLSDLVTRRKGVEAPCML